MYNPLYPFTRAVLDALIAKGNRYFVRQSYERGSEEGREGLLMTPYVDLARAEAHMKAIKGDRRAKLYFTGIENLMTDLKTAASQPPGFRIYSDQLKMAGDWAPPKWLSYKMTGYIKSEFGWPIDRVEINTGLSFEFGRLVVKFYRRGVLKKAPLDEIEKIKY